MLWSVVVSAGVVSVRNYFALNVSMAGGGGNDHAAVVSDSVTTTTVPNDDLRVPDDDDDDSTKMTSYPPSLSTEREASTSTSTKTVTTTGPLNVLILYPDDWRHDTLGKARKEIKTPVLDSLADRGVRFTHNHVTTSICWISRATLFTGRYASSHQSNKLYCPNFARPDNWKHAWPSVLRDRGNYFVGQIGKWQYHNDPCKDGSFDDFCTRYEGDHWIDQFGGSRITASARARNDTIDFLRTRPKDKKFALTVAFYPPKAVGVSREPGGQWFPHPKYRAIYENATIPEPYNTTDAYRRLPPFLQGEGTVARTRWRERFQTPRHFQEAMRNYYALVSQVDGAVGRILEELEAQGLMNETVIIFTADNGLFQGAHGLAGKWYPYDEAVRVPLIVYDPRMPPERIGTEDDSLTLNVDLAETVLGAAGIKADASFMQGRDLAELYLPNATTTTTTTTGVFKPWRREFFYEFPSGVEGGIDGSTALIRRDWKYTKWTDHDYEELFHTSADPLELHDLWGRPEHEKRLVEMRARHDELRAIIQSDEIETQPCKRPFVPWKEESKQKRT